MNSLKFITLKNLSQCSKNCFDIQLRLTGKFTAQRTISNKTLTLDNLNPCIKAMEIVVRGPLVERASEVTKELQQGVKKPFKEVLQLDIGDCHAMGQVPITFIRQILAVVSYPALLNDSKFPDDVKSRAKDILKACRGGSVGSYTEESGIELIKQHIAEYIEKRDNQPCNWENVILSAGASNGIKSVLSLLNCKNEGKRPGVMAPIPQYPLYSACLTEFNMEQIGYYLNEDTNWGLDISELERSINEAKNICNPRAIVVINPGNPTGQVLTKKNIEEIIKFAKKEKLFILADEVYQDNVYAPGSEFHSFKKVLMEMKHPYDKMELASFMSCSKGTLPHDPPLNSIPFIMGYMGECGLRGGYSEIINLDPGVRAMFLKLLSAWLCPTVLGQTAMDCVVNPPCIGDPSYDKYINEKQTILDNLKFKAKMIEEILNSIEGITCNVVQGAMYAFPQIKLPDKAVAKAEEMNQCPSVMYTFELFEKTGICIMPGAGFGQKPGTYHFRTTILPQADILKQSLETFKQFHIKFLKEYS